MKNSTNYKKIIIYVMDIITILLLCYYCYVLTYKMMNVQLGDVKYLSDYTTHLYGAMTGSGYSLMHIIFRTVINISYNKHILSLVMVVIVLLTILGTSAFLRFLTNYLSEEKPGFEITTFIAAASVLLASIYIPFFQPHFYISRTMLTQPWHNSTYLLMRMFAVIAFLLFIKLQDSYIEKFDYKTAVAFTMVLTLVNYAKPSFIIAFSPIVLFMLIYDLVNTKGKSFFPAFKFGICILISLSVVAVQYMTLFGEDDEAGTAFTLHKFYELITNPASYISLICNLAFPIFVLVICIYLKRKDTNISLRVLILSWAMFLLSRLEGVFITETGSRASDGNFSWGTYYFAFQLSIVSAAYLMAVRKNLKWGNYIGWLLYLACTISGIAYFRLLLQGVYFII